MSATGHEIYVMDGHTVARALRFVKMVRRMVPWRKGPFSALFTSPDEANVQRKVLLMVLPILNP